MQENLEHLTKTHKKTSQLQNGSTQTWKIKTSEMKEKKKKKIIVSGLVLMSYKIACRAGKQQQMEELDHRGLLVCTAGSTHIIYYTHTHTHNRTPPNKQNTKTSSHFFFLIFFGSIVNNLLFFLSVFIGFEIYAIFLWNDYHFLLFFFFFPPL